MTLSIPFYRYTFPMHISFPWSNFKREYGKANWKKMEEIPNARPKANRILSVEDQTN